MISFIDEHHGVFGVEPICRLLPIAPSTYYENVTKRLDVDRLSIRARSDIGLKIEIRRVFEHNFQVYGVRKVWRQLQREGFDIARIDRCSRKCKRRITLGNAMSITPEPPLKTCEGRLKHGSILNGNIRLRRVSSQWKSTGSPLDR